MNLPKKYRGTGLHVFCTRCNKTVTPDPCQHTNKQSFQSRIYNPITKRQDRIKTHSVETAKEAYKLHTAYRDQLENNNFEVPQFKTQEEKPPVFLLEAVAMYCDWLRDIDLPSFQHKNHKPKHIAAQELYLSRFLKALKPHYSRLADLPLVNIGNIEIGFFDSLLVEMQLSESTYNTQMKAVKYFFQFLIDKKKVDIVNPIEAVKMKSLFYAPEILTESEISKLFSVMTPENGIGTKGVNKDTVNYYRPWLVDAFKFILLTGERRGGAVYLQWKHYKENHLIIPNRKVNESKRTDKYKNYTYITEDLAEVLLSLSPSDPEQYIIAPDMSNRTTLANHLSRAFAHYWKFTGINKPVSLKHFRSTYLSRMGDVLGDHAKLLKHTNPETMLKHYFNELEMVEKTSKKLEGVRLFEI